MTRGKCHRTRCCGRWFAASETTLHSTSHSDHCNMQQTFPAPIATTKDTSLSAVHIYSLGTPTIIPISTYFKNILSVQSTVFTDFCTLITVRPNHIVWRCSIVCYMTGRTMELHRMVRRWLAMKTYTNAVNSARSIDHCAMHLKIYFCDCVNIAQ